MSSAAAERLTPATTPFLAAVSTDAAADALFYLVLVWVAARSGAVSAAVVLAAATVPQLAMMLVGGALGDRLGVARTATITLVCRTVVFCAFAVIIVAGQVTSWSLMAVAAAVGLLDALHMPSMGGITGLLASDGQQAAMQGAVSAATRVSGVAATALGGVLLAWATQSAAWAMAGLSASAVALLWMTRRRAAERLSVVAVGDDAAPSLGRLVRDGLRFVTDHPRVRMVLVMFALANFAATSAVMLGVPLKGSSLGWSPAGYGVVMAAFSAGSALGAVGVVRWRARAKDNLVAALGFLSVSALGVGVLAVVDGAWGAAVACFFVGLTLAPAVALMMGEVRELTPATHMGRVGSLISLSIFGLIPVGHLVFGWLATAVSLHAAGLAMCGVLAVSTAGGEFMRRRNPALVEARS